MGSGSGGGLAALQSKPWFIWVVVGILALCLLWIMSMVFSSCGGGNKGPATHPPQGASWVAGREATEELHKDERFGAITIAPDPENEATVLVVAGPIKKANETALKAKVQELNLTYEIRYDLYDPATGK